MTKNYALFLLNQLCVGASVDAKPIIPQFELAQALNVAIKALGQQPCEDCISRQEAISAIQDEYYADAVGIDIVDIVAHLPSVTPTRPTGRWIRWYEVIESADGKSTDHIPHCKCSECGTKYDPHSSQFIKYCNECGARMVESEEEE